LATIRDVARAAGVSIATVSRVFNNNSLVKNETARRVLKVAAAVDYWPNGAAQSLTTRCSNTFGVLLPDLFGEFYSEVIRGIDQIARRQRYQLLLSSSHASSEDILSAARAMLGRIDGLVMMAPESASIETVRRIRRRLPVVLLNPGIDVTGCCSVSVDNHAGSGMATEHLLRLGHRDIAMIAGPEGNGDAEDRLSGFREALAQAGIDPASAPVIPGDFHETSGYEAMRSPPGGRARPRSSSPTTTWRSVC
jgi:LacI family transcriptional regulator